MLADFLVPPIVVALVVYVWIVEPVRWFRRRRKTRPLPDVWAV